MHLKVRVPNMSFFKFFWSVEKPDANPEKGIVRPDTRMHTNHRLRPRQPPPPPYYLWLKTFISHRLH
jgi:hypothetical protein